MEFDELKSSWQSATRNINTDGDRRPNGNRKSALQRLEAQYRRLSILSICFMFVGPGALWNAGIKSIWVLAGYFILLGAASVTDYYLAGAIRAIKPSVMSVSEVVARTMKCRKIHLMWVAFALPFVLFWCGATAYAAKANEYFVYGIVAGGFVGLILGARMLIRFMQDYREVMED